MSNAATTDSELPVQFNPEIRELLRQRGEPVRLHLALTERDRDVRLTCPQIAVDMYEDIPAETTAWYLPDEHALILDLPDPDDDNATLSMFADDSHALHAGDDRDDE